MAKRRLRAFGVALAGLAVGACSPLGVLDTLVPDDTYSETRAIPYGSHARQKLDVYRPLNTPLNADETAPVVVFFYGGSWKYGERGKYRFVGEALASRGIVTVVPDYRLYPEVRFPAFLEDSAAAIAWTKREIAAYGGDPDRLFVAGHSAGAYNAAMLAVAPAYLEAAGLSQADLCGAVSLAGPIALDLTDYNSTRPIFAHVADVESTRPALLVREGAPPFLLVHGRADGTVYPVNTEMFEQALRHAGTPVSAHYPEGVGHYRIIAGMADPLEGIVGAMPLADMVAAFVRDEGGCAG